MSLRRVAAVARVQVTELARRRLAVVMLIALPLSFYWASADDKFAVTFATVGVGWTVAIISLFLSHSMMAITPRLALIGYRPAEIVLGRILAVTTFSAIVATGLFLYLRTDPVVIDDGYLALSLFFATFASAATGLAVGALISREMEAMLLLMGLIALTLVVDFESLLAKLLPMHATYRYSWSSTRGVVWPDDSPWMWTTGLAAVFSVIAVVATVLRVPKANQTT